ncbi:MAG: ABC transporter substrate-binding protein [Oscillospiraceae bacterium]|nr:ABC transporter substrate-binding protein [Oscillospiraceae bacterium]
MLGQRKTIKIFIYILIITSIHWLFIVIINDSLIINDLITDNYINDINLFFNIESNNYADKNLSGTILNIYGLFGYIDDCVYIDDFYNHEKRLNYNLWDEFENETGIIIHKNKNYINFDEYEKAFDARYYSINRFSDITMRIMAGVESDVIQIFEDEMEFFISNSLILPLNNTYTYIAQYIHAYKIFNDVYGLKIPIISTYIWFYNKEIIHKLGLRDPLVLWTERKWNWENWLEMLFAIKNEMSINLIEIQYDYSKLNVPNSIDVFMVSNGVEYFKVDDNGKFYFINDSKIINTINFVHKLNNDLNIDIFNSQLSRMSIIDEQLFMKYDVLSPVSYRFNTNQARNELTHEYHGIANDIIGIVTTPIGPDLDNNFFLEK